MLSARLETCPRVTFSGAGTAAVSAPLALSLSVSPLSAELSLPLSPLLLLSLVSVLCPLRLSVLLQTLLILQHFKDISRL